MKPNLLAFALLAIIVWLTPCFTFAAEPWSDAKLTIREGLELWLDASRATGDQLIPADGRLTQWRDASGKGRHLLQDTEAARAIRLGVGNVAVVRFDGTDDHMRVVKQSAELNSFSIFLVAAARRNFGAFRGFMALNAANQKDYTSGLTIDLGPGASPQFSVLNVEGRGFGGAQNLRTTQSPFGHLSTIEVTSDAAAKTVLLTLDGKREGERPRDGAPLSFEEITIGARYYNNGAGPQHVDGYSHCDIAEVLVYSRILNSEETIAVRDYLSAKYSSVKQELPPDGDGRGEQLVTVANPPPVQVFLPGFSVRELPVDLTNVNNVKYRTDGTLVALNYDGTIWLLRDTNGDGIEDDVTQYWENKSALRAAIGMDLTPPDYVHGDGVFVVGKTRCVLIVDSDHDGKGDKEIEVAGGWKESFHTVDGLGVAFDARDGSIYYGRGTYNFADPLLRDKDGQPHYSLTDESSAILRVSPDFKTREIVATGIRFPVGLRFNRHGDLFATDQEGATWVANGNPFDELLHIQKGRHYGFPARHPKFLPNVIDEPSTFDYGPQHQSACGLNFNEPVKEGGKTFGPPDWAGDAIVAGYSRGKLYRTELVKTSVGYVARTHLLACLQMLTVDACVSPDGGLIVACHSGGPDWGSGPTGKGKLFKITYEDPSHPQPALVWPSGPQEVHVEFDRPVDLALLKKVLSQSKLTGGRYVRAGDRFETVWPGYAAVQIQKASPRYDVALRSAQLTADRRTLVLATDLLTTSQNCALTLSGMGRPLPDSSGTVFLRQHAAIDVDFDLTGCDATWTPADGSAAWTGWLPHLDLQVARALTRGSASHDALWTAMRKPGQLELRTQLDLVDMLRPALQPGSQIDYEYPPETVTVTLESTSPMQMITPPTGDPSLRDQRVSITPAPGQKKMVPVVLRLDVAAENPSLSVRWTTNEDDRPRPLPLRRVFVPWADTSGKTQEPTALPRPPELAGGSWARGRKSFFGDQAACAKCHSIHGQGGDLGPDLSNLVHRDYASVLRDITSPSFAINPDHLSYNISLRDGRVVSGVVRSANDKMRIGDSKGAVIEIDAAEIEEMKPSSLSTMPEGIPKLLGPQQMRDLLTFLLMPPPQMPRDYVGGPRPKPRTMSEVNAVLAGSPMTPAPIRPIRVVLVAGPKDHGPGEHDYPAWQKAWTELLTAGEQIHVASGWQWPAKEDFQTADVIVFFQHGEWNEQRAADIDAFLDRGGGLVYIHWAIDGGKFGREFGERIGLAALGAVGFRHGELTLKFNHAANHPVTRNFDSLSLTDETYWKMVGPLSAERILATAVEENQAQPQLWSVERGQGRVFVSIPGHYSWTFDDPMFRVLILRAIAWTAREPVDRFNDLVWPGAEFVK